MNTVYSKIVLISFRYQRPIGEPSQALLRMFLGFDYNDNLTSIEARTGPAGSPSKKIRIKMKFLHYFFL